MIHVEGPIYQVRNWVEENVDYIQHFQFDKEVVVAAENIDLILNRHSPDDPMWGQAGPERRSSMHAGLFNFIEVGQIHGYRLPDETNLSVYWEPSVKEINRVYEFFGGTLLRAVGCEKGGVISPEHYEEHLLNLEYPIATYEWNVVAHDKSFAGHAGAMLFIPKGILHDLLSTAAEIYDPEIFCDIFDKFTGFGSSYVLTKHNAEFNNSDLAKKKLPEIKNRFENIVVRAFGTKADPDSILSRVDEQVERIKPKILQAGHEFIAVIA